MESFFPEIQLPSDLLKELREYGKHTICKHKDVVIFEQQHLEELYLIEAGFVKYSLFSIEGGVQTICYLGKGFFLGDYPYICGGDTSIVNIEAATDLELLVFGQNVKDALYKIEGFRILLLRNMAYFAKIAKNQIVNISLTNSEQRIRKTLDDGDKHFNMLGKNKHNKCCLTNKEIADLSGCSLETVNRFIKGQTKS